MPKPAFPTTREQRIEVYLRIMEEIKERLRIVATLKEANIRPGQAREICFLELRHICELIAVGCLAAQGPLKMSGVFADEYSPNKIFKALEPTWPHFFPQSADVIHSKDGKTTIRANTKKNALTRKEAERLWSNSGNFLHRLSVKNFFRSQSDSNQFWIEIDAHISKITDLLRSHIITVADPKSMFVVTLTAKNGLAEAVILNYGHETGGRMTYEVFSLVSPGQ